VVKASLQHLALVGPTTTSPSGVERGALGEGIDWRGHTLGLVEPAGAFYTDKTPPALWLWGCPWFRFPNPRFRP
jgi:hypothetical protein